MNSAVHAQIQNGHGEQVEYGWKTSLSGHLEMLLLQKHSFWHVFTFLALVCTC